MLSIKKENSGGDVTDVEVSCVNGRFIHIDDVDGGHITQVMGSFRQLKSREMTDQ